MQQLQRGQAGSGRVGGGRVGRVGKGCGSKREGGTGGERFGGVVESAEGVRAEGGRRQFFRTKSYKKGHNSVCFMGW